MSDTLKLIERVRAVTQTGTDYAVAKALEMDQSYLILVKKGKRFPGMKAQLKMAELLGIDLKDIVAVINGDKADNEADRAYWRSLWSERLHQALAGASTTAAGVLIALALYMQSAPSSAAPYGATRHAIHYAHWLRRLVARFKWRSQGVLTPWTPVTAVA